MHEAWLRVNGSERQEWKNRQHFLAAAAEAMRRILVDRARRKQRLRHGGGHQRVDLEDLDAIDAPAARDDAKCLRVDEALVLLEQDDPEKAEIVKLRVFAGLQVREIAALKGCSEKTIQRHWTFARAWLTRALDGED